MTTVNLYRADCLDILRALPANSVDSVVTDPPYGLGNTSTAQVTETLTAWLSGDREYLPGGTGFMGQAWDAFVPPVAVWDECYRVLKPGGHVLAFAGARTQDLMGLGLRLAGFDLRDSIAWLFSQGFPKSLNVSDAIDKQRDDKPAALVVTAWLNKQRKAAGVLPSAILADFGFNAGSGQVGHWTALSLGGQPTVPTWEQWERLRAMLGFGTDMDAEVWRLNGRKGTPGAAWEAREVTGVHDAAAPAQLWMNNHGKPADLTAKERRDIPQSDAAKEWAGWGTALKPGHEPIVMARKPLAGTVAANVAAHRTGALNIDANRYGNVLPGRWPANVIIDEQQADALEEVKPGASRFFYTPKASKSERPNVNGVQHGTVKPLELMRHLVRLVTPPGGTVLEPFAGSGTTVEAAMLEGFDVIAVEREPDYLPLILERIRRSSADATTVNAYELGYEMAAAA